jgi:hypothetical protein
LTEGTLLTLITLQPDNCSLPTVTIQPLLCSDALSLSTDSPGMNPMDAVNHSADCFLVRPPDHIDIVSVATHTPSAPASAKAGARLTWHAEFLNTFIKAADNEALARHRHATFVLANPRILGDGEQGGLSGAFVPAPPRGEHWPDYLSLHSYGQADRTASSHNEWCFPANLEQLSKNASFRGYLACLEPPGDKPAFMLEFTLHRMLRDASRWQPPQGLQNSRLHAADFDPDQNQDGDATHPRMIFRPWSVP